MRLRIKIDMHINVFGWVLGVICKYIGLPSAHHCIQMTSMYLYDD